MGTVNTESGKKKADDVGAASSSLIRSLYTKLKHLENDRSKVLTTLVVGSILDTVGFDTDYTMLRYEYQCCCCHILSFL